MVEPRDDDVPDPRGLRRDRADDDEGREILLLAPRTIAALFALFTVVGIAVSVLFFPAEWSLLRRLVFGVILGVGSGLCLFANRLVG